MQLFGRTYSRRELEARVGRLDQIGGLRRSRGVEGAEAGVERVEVRTGGGLRYEVLPTRGMDIGLTTFGGVPLCWHSPNGVPHPAFYDAEGLGWLRTAVGGLLMTCGLSQVGAPSEDGGEALGLHGRAHHSPAREVVAEGRWDEDDYTMRVAGSVEETSLFAPTLRLRREITSRLGENRIAIHDVVENRGFAPAPHMILYHFNFGFPLLSEDCELRFPSSEVTPREPTTPVEEYESWSAPDPTYAERVYYHTLDRGAVDGRAHFELRTPHFPMAGGGTRPLVVRLTWSVATLPRLVQWKMAGAGAHVLGIEPANSLVDGRAAERARGSLVILEPGESRHYELTLEVIAP